MLIQIIGYFCTIGLVYTVVELKWHFLEIAAKIVPWAQFSAFFSRREWIGVKLALQQPNCAHDATVCLEDFVRYETGFASFSVSSLGRKLLMAISFIVVGS